MRILYSSCVLPEQGKALESSSTGGVEYFGESSCGRVDAAWKSWRRSSRGGIPVGGGREKESRLLRELRVFWKCQLLISSSWQGAWGAKRGRINRLRRTIPPSLPVENSFLGFLRSLPLSLSKCYYMLTLETVQSCISRHTLHAHPKS